MIKEIKYNGYTEVPSDYECPDGDLATAMNVNAEDGSLEAMLPPTLLAEMPSGYRIVFVHATSQMKHYIVYRDTYREFYWLDAAVIDNSQTKPVPSATILSSLNLLVSFESELFYDWHNINAVGNTLMIMDASGIRYYLWQNSSYTSLGNHIPELPISFGLQAEMVRSDKYTQDFRNTSLTAIPLSRFTDGFTDDESLLITNDILGKVNKFIQERANEAGKFIYPFMVRYAYRMFDDTLTMHSAPVLMVCSTDVAPLVAMKPYEDQGALGMVWKMEYYVAGALHTLDYQVLDSSAIAQLSRWKDIIRSVDIFISAPIYTYDQSGKIEKFEEYDGSGSYCIAKFGYSYGKNYISEMYNDTFSDTSEFSYMLTLPHFSVDQVRDDIKSCHDFYLLESVNINSLTTDRQVLAIERDYLSSLRAREVMTDDYDSHDLLKPIYSFNYNSRLNIANLQKDLFIGFGVDTMTAYTNESGTTTWRAYVHIRQDGKEIVVQGEDVQVDAGRPVLMLYYPNVNAYKITLYRMSEYKEYPLAAHDFLNGAFYFRGWYEVQTRVYDEGEEPIPTQNNTVNMPNKVYTSEVNNPFNFPVLGINTVGVGEIKGMAAATRALSEGQFGQFPMYVFSTEGVWALETITRTDPDSVIVPGLYSSAKPVTRDVCVNTKSITSIDTAVLFAAKRGIMLLSGSNTQCISDSLDVEQVFDISQLPASVEVLSAAGVSAESVALKPFKQFVRYCRMLYDYTNQRIIVYEPWQLNVLTHDEAKYAYVYNLKSHKWGMIASSIHDGINSYPECLAQTSDGLADFSDLKHTTTVTIDGQTETVLTNVNGLIVTRPLKLDNPNNLKTIRTIIQRGMFESGHVKSVLYGSRDLLHWYLIGSSVDHSLRGISGTPYKYFRLALPVMLTDMEHLYGCTIEYEVKETNRLR
ncbi:MAG: hypothetical protein IJM43_08235 [Bacteroidaceae bacterium]|nr:hypothetical protein [Bacteroidaceae bacterium]